MSKTRFLVVGSLFVGAALPLFASPFQLHGILSQDTAYGIQEPEKFTKNRSQLSLEETGKLTDEVRFKFSERMFFDSVAHHQNESNEDTPGFVKNDLASEAQFRDAYVDVSHGNMDLRLGKQQIVWGEAVALFVADVVDAKDLREYILPDFDWIRIPQWSADAAYTKGQFHNDLILSIPKFNKYATPGSEFAFPLPAPPDFASTSSDPKEPSTTWENVEAGDKLSVLMGGLDLSAFYLYGWNQSPVFFRTLNNGVFNFQPAYRRQSTVGLTFSKDIFDSILKGEMVFKPQAYFSTLDPKDADGIVRKDNVNYVLGLDKTFSNNVNANFQITQQFILDAGDALANERATLTFLTFWIKTTLWNKRIEPEYLIIADAARKDRLHRPKIGFRISDQIRLQLGADIFEGHPNQGLFGMFDQQDRAYAVVELYF